MANSLILFERGAQLLAEADTLQKAKELKDLSLTAADWAKRKGMGYEAIQYCRGYALEAERRLGELLDVTDRAPAGRKKKNQVPDVLDLPPTLKQLGIKPREANEAHLLSEIPREVFEEVKTGKVTKADLKRQKKKREHQNKVSRVEKSRKENPVGPFDLILADPPWRYDFHKDQNRQIENQYETADLASIISDKPQSSPDSILFLWATAPKLEEALKVLNAWGFTYRTCAVWDKEVIGMGYWFRVQHELILVGVKGNPGATPECENRSSIFREKRRGHSQKPEVIYEWIERAFPELRKLEMYCRKPRPGWAVMGNEC